MRGCQLTKALRGSSHKHDMARHATNAHAVYKEQDSRTNSCRQTKAYLFMMTDSSDSSSILSASCTCSDRRRYTDKNTFHPTTHLATSLKHNRGPGVSCARPQPAGAQFSPQQTWTGIATVRSRQTHTPETMTTSRAYIQILPTEKRTSSAGSSFALNCLSLQMVTHFSCS